MFISIKKSMAFINQMTGKIPSKLLLEGSTRVVPDPDGNLISLFTCYRFTYVFIDNANSYFFNSPVCRGYIRKVSVNLVQKYFPHDCSTDSIS